MNRPGLPVVFGLIALVALGGAVPAALAAEAEPVAVTTRTIDAFRIGAAESRFGPLEFVGGLELTAASRRFGGFSAFRFLSPGKDFLGVADNGQWFTGRIARDGQGRPAGVEAFTLQPILDAGGKPPKSKLDADAEGLAVRDGVAIVGFERRHRLTRYRLAPGRMGPAIGNLDFLVPVNELRQNRGFETLTHAPDGALVAISEMSLDREGNIFAAVLSGPRKGVFTVKRNGDWDITDGAFLPGGDLLLLERRFSFSGGVGMRLRRIPGASVTKGAVADGPILLDADMGDQIDNMEGLDVWRRDDGATMVALLSDDNRSFLQRNLYLEFRLHED